MHAITDFQPSLLVLMRETFEGVPHGASGTWFVQGKEGIFDAISTTAAVQASIRPAAGCSSIAGHVNHIRYALRLVNSEFGGEKPAGTWESSWDHQTVSEEEWDWMREDVHAEYGKFLDWLETNHDWSGEDVAIYTLSQLPHMAYHLGAIRQIMKIVAQSG